MPTTIADMRTKGLPPVGTRIIVTAALTNCQSVISTEASASGFRDIYEPNGRVLSMLPVILSSRLHHRVALSAASRCRDFIAHTRSADPKPLFIFAGEIRKADFGPNIGRVYLLVHDLRFADADFDYLPFIIEDAITALEYVARIRALFS